MLKIASYMTGVERGSLILFSDFQTGGAMWTGEGPREMRHEVRFESPFSAAPAVLPSLTMWDMDNQHNARMDLSAENVTAAGFELVFRTWGDTRVARVRADWMAIGPSPNDDDWSVD